MTAVNILIDGTITAAWMILEAKGYDTKEVAANDEHLTKLTNSIKSVLKANLSEVLKEWESAVDAHTSEAWLREMMKVQCNDLALKAVKVAGFIN